MRQPTKKQMGNIHREMEILSKNKKEMMDIKSNITDTKNAFDGLSSRLDIA